MPVSQQICCGCRPLSFSASAAWTTPYPMQGCDLGRPVGLTWHNPNSSVLVEGPEIAIHPVVMSRFNRGLRQRLRRRGAVERCLNHGHRRSSWNRQDGTTRLTASLTRNLSRRIRCVHGWGSVRRRRDALSRLFVPSSRHGSRTVWSTRVPRVRQMGQAALVA